MPAEIELKLFFPLQVRSDIITHFSRLEAAISQEPIHLANAYFDTPQLDLRALDMGLRIRSGINVNEQTIKTSGKVVGGIHSRPEYNVDISGNFPELALFPPHIWPSSESAASLQSQLYCLFNTDFERRCWHIQLGESLVEVALDLGSISSDNAKGEAAMSSVSEPICELEFELLSGKPAALLTLAQDLAAKVPVAIARASKAQRGYRIAGLGALPKLKAIADISELSQGSGALAVLEYGLDAWPLLLENLAVLTPLMNGANLSAIIDAWSQLISVLELLQGAVVTISSKIEPEKLAAVNLEFTKVKDCLSQVIELLNTLANASEAPNAWPQITSEQRPEQTQELLQFNWLEQLKQLQHNLVMGQLQLNLLGLLLAGSGKE
ncbi:CYTH domain-containing protein [Shewanella sp. SNU WT4]|uniref:CYTH domain-containing protein n=1 Tax=Shewanella sp. SNU WT4 TaxID=2590015 RepID=UPI0011271263|nr:CYTH domain-containing protein [Shewanella sp. SNU WT4]QDF68065.1 CYTH domain-containing protein [Shewanella sp. SNU WT4]